MKYFIQSLFALKNSYIDKNIYFQLHRFLKSHLETWSSWELYQTRKVSHKCKPNYFIISFIPKIILYTHLQQHSRNIFRFPHSGKDSFLSSLDFNSNFHFKHLFK